MEITEEWKARFNAKWEKDESGCWIWSGCKAGKGYGILKIPKTRKQIYAHRLSYLIHRGEIQEGEYVLHRCDNPACVNPAHLFLGSAKDNAQDMAAKGRHLFGERNKNPEQILTSRDVVKIKKLLAMNSFSQKEIGRMFCVAQITISRIHRGLRWKHITNGDPR